MESPNDKTIKVKEDEWQVVNKKKSFKSPIPKKREMQKVLHERPYIVKSVESLDCSKQAESLGENIENLVVTLKGSAFYQQVVANLVSTEYHSLICLGLGNFSESEPARLQLAMVVGLIRDLFGNEHKAEDACVLDSERKLFAFDPIFGEIETIVLHRLGFHTLTENRFGKIRIVDNTKTLFYMPHCPYGLYCSVLWENWSCLDQIGILGNSFSSYNARRLGVSNARPTDCVSYLSTLVEERSFWNSTFARQTSRDLFWMEHAFNDTSLHTFSAEMLQSTAGISLLSKRPTEDELDAVLRADQEVT